MRTVECATWRDIERGDKDAAMVDTGSAATDGRGMSGNAEVETMGRFLRRSIADAIA